MLAERRSILPESWGEYVTITRRMVLFGALAIYIVFFTWMFWWRFVTYHDYLRDRADCPPGTVASIKVEYRRVPQPGTTNVILVASKRGECVVIPDPSQVRP